MRWLLLSVLSLFHVSVSAESLMTQERMEQIIKGMAEQSLGEKGAVRFSFQGMDMFLASDVSHDRMRIISPIIQYSKLSNSQLTRIMESNYHSALDARYALSDDVLYAAYIHPMSKLDEDQLKNALMQVFNLKASFGTDYSSGLLNYGGDTSKASKKL